MLSYAHGPSAVPLLGETIGENLRRTVERFPDRDALVVALAGLPRHLPRALGRDHGRWPAPCSPPAIAGRGPRRHLGAEPLRVGDRAVRHGAHRRHPRQHQPGLQDRRAALRPAPVRACSCCCWRALSQSATTWRLLAEVRRRLPRPARGRGPRRRLGRLPGPRARAPARRTSPRARPGSSSTTPSTSSTPRAPPALPKGATLSHHNILNNGFFLGETLRLHRDGPRLHPGALLPLLRHGDRQPGLHHPRRLHRDPGEAFDPLLALEAVQRRALHVALRRAHHVHRRAGAPALRASSTSPRCAPASWPARRAPSR